MQSVASARSEASRLATTVSGARRSPLRTVRLLVVITTLSRGTSAMALPTMGSVP